MRVKIVVLDSNVLIADSDLASSPLVLLLEQCRRGEAHLVIPDIVLTEVVEKRRQRLIEATEAYGKAAKGIGALTGGQVPASPSLDVNRLSAEYETRIRSLVAGAGGTIAAFPPGRLATIVLKDISGRAPIVAGVGWRDALIWEVVLAQLPAGEVVFVSKDKGFAATDGQLKASLANEVAELGGSPVKLYPSLHRYAIAEAPPSVFAVVNARQALDHDASLRDDLEGQISASLLALPESEIAGVRLFEQSLDRVGTTLESAWPTAVDVLAAQDLGAESFNVDMRVLADAEVETFLFKYEIGGLSDDEMDSIVDADFNEGLMRVAVSRPLEVSLSATFTMNPRAFTNVWIDAVTDG